MTWTRLSDGFADSPEVLALSDAAFRAHVTALIWSNRQLTDGAIPARAVRLFTAADPAEIINELVASGLWVEYGASFQLDWADQETANAVAERKAKGAKRQENFRKAKEERERRHGDGDHSLCKPEYCNASRNASHDASQTLPRTRPDPDPTPRGGEGEGRAKTGSDVAAPSATAAGASPSDPLERMRAISAAGRKTA